MAVEVIKRLGATTVGLNIDTTLYLVPSNTMTALSCINACNMSASGVSIRIAHVDGRINEVSAEDYIAYDELVPARTNIAYQMGICMEAADTIMVRGDGSGVSFAFQAWGSEVT